MCRLSAAYSDSVANAVCRRFYPLFHARWTTVRGVTPPANRPVSVCPGIYAVVRGLLAAGTRRFIFRPFSGVPANSKMSKADRLLAKLPPATPLPSFVTDALNGTRRHARSIRSSRPIVFRFCLLQIPKHPRSRSTPC